MPTRPTLAASSPTTCCSTSGPSCRPSPSRYIKSCELNLIGSTFRKAAFSCRVFCYWPSTAFSPCWRSRSPAWPPSHTSCRTSASQSLYSSPSSLGMLVSHDFCIIFYFNWNLVILYIIFLKGKFVPCLPKLKFRVGMGSTLWLPVSPC